MTALLALTLNGFREARRNRVTVVAYAFALVLIFSSTFALEITVATFDRVMSDLGLGVMGLIEAALTVFLGTALIPREIERRTVFMVVSKPVSRSTFVVSRYLGNLLTVGFILAVMSVLFLAQLAYNGGETGLGSGVRVPHFVAIWGIFLEAVLLSALCIAFGTASSQMVASVAVVGLYLIGHISEDLYLYAANAKEPVWRYLGKAAYYVLPNFDRVDWKARATYLDPTSFSEVASSTIYVAAYAAFLLVIASAIFERRDFK